MSIATATRQTVTFDCRAYGRNIAGIRARARAALPPAYFAVFDAIADRTRYGANRQGCFERTAKIAARCRSTRSDKEQRISERHFRRLANAMAADPDAPDAGPFAGWLEREHHVRRDPRYVYRTYWLGPKAAIVPMHDASISAVGAGGQSGPAPISFGVGAGGQSGPVASGRLCPDDGGPSLLCRDEFIEETTTKSGETAVSAVPDPDQSSSFSEVGTGGGDPLESKTPEPPLSPVHAISPDSPASPAEKPEKGPESPQDAAEIDEALVVSLVPRIVAMLGLAADQARGKIEAAARMFEGRDPNTVLGWIWFLLDEAARKKKRVSSWGWFLGGLANLHREGGPAQAPPKPKLFVQPPPWKRPPAEPEPPVDPEEQARFRALCQSFRCDGPSAAGRGSKADELEREADELERQADQIDSEALRQQARRKREQAKVTRRPTP